MNKITAVAIFSLALCVGCSSLDAAATAQNLANVKALAVENEALWQASGKPASLVHNAQDFSDAAIALATKLAGK